MPSARFADPARRDLPMAGQEARRRHVPGTAPLGVHEERQPGAGRLPCDGRPVDRHRADERLLRSDRRGMPAMGTPRGVAAGAGAMRLTVFQSRARVCRAGRAARPGPPRHPRRWRSAAHLGGTTCPQPAPPRRRCCHCRPGPARGTASRASPPRGAANGKGRRCCHPRPSGNRTVRRSADQANHQRSIQRSPSRSQLVPNVSPWAILSDSAKTKEANIGTTTPPSLLTISCIS